VQFEDAASRSVALVAAQVRPEIEDALFVAFHRCFVRRAQSIMAYDMAANGVAEAMEAIGAMRVMGAALHPA
jgi:hypothetical protein